MAAALKVMDESHKYFDTFVAISKRMAEKAVDKAMVEKFINGIYSDAKHNGKKRQMIEHLFERGQGNKGETLWDLYNGSTEYFNHFDSSSDEKRLESLLWEYCK